MLYVERDKVLLSFCLQPSRSGEQSLVVSLRTARCKIDLVWYCGVDAFSDYCSCLIERFLRALSVAVKAVRIAVELVKTLYELVSCRLAEIRCCGIVSINSH